MATDQFGILASRLEELNRVGAALSAERDTAGLLELILTKAREITASDAGSLHIVETADTQAARLNEPPRTLRFMIAQNDSIAQPFKGGEIAVSRSAAGFGGGGRDVCHDLHRRPRRARDVSRVAGGRALEDRGVSVLTFRIADRGFRIPER